MTAFVPHLPLRLLPQNPKAPTPCSSQRHPPTLSQTMMTSRNNNTKPTPPPNPLGGFNPAEFLTIHSAVNSTLSSTPTPDAPSSNIADDLSKLYGEGPDKSGRFRDSIAAISREPVLVQRLRTQTLLKYGAELGSMMMPAVQTGFLCRLARAVGVKRVFEVGTFTGMGCLVFAMAGAGVEVMSCDVDLEAWEEVGKGVVEDAGIGERVEVVNGRGLEVMKEMLRRGGGGCWDLVFIDGDKEEYWECFELGLEMVRKGGVIVVDDIMWSGRVEEGKSDDETLGIRRCIDNALKDDRVDTTVLRIGDGLLVSLKR